ncbi:hypothetical protein ACJX0J_031185, partial [Zea mays]
LYNLYGCSSLIILSLCFASICITLYSIYFLTLDLWSKITQEFFWQLMPDDTPIYSSHIRRIPSGQPPLHKVVLPLANILTLPFIWFAHVALCVDCFLQLFFGPPFFGGDAGPGLDSMGDMGDGTGHV